VGQTPARLDHTHCSNLTQDLSVRRMAFFPVVRAGKKHCIAYVCKSFCAQYRRRYVSNMRATEGAGRAPARPARCRRCPARARRRPWPPAPQTLRCGMTLASSAAGSTDMLGLRSRHEACLHEQLRTAAPHSRSQPRACPLAHPHAHPHNDKVSRPSSASTATHSMAAASGTRTSVAVWRLAQTPLVL